MALFVANKTQFTWFGVCHQFKDATTHLYKRSCPSVCGSVCGSVCPMLFSNNKKRHFLCSDDDEIWHEPRDSQGQFMNDIKISVRQSVRPSDERKRTKSAASYEPRGSRSLPRPLLLPFSPSFFNMLLHQSS